MQPVGNNKRRQIITTLAVLIVVVAIVAAVTVTNKKETNANTADTASTTTSKQEGTASDTSANASTVTDTGGSSTGSTTASSSTYKDGTYTATGSYSSPGGNESISITVTLANDIITSTSARSGATDAEAKEYQSDFISGYKSLVVGKDIDSVSLSRVSGSSLTSQGFNNAIQKIESQAKA